jgi:hypothetical protein
MKYFTLKEMIKSYTASKYKIDNTPDEKAAFCLIRLINHVLDPLREKYGKPIYVSSGYRCPKLNSLVKGSKTSQHLYGQAADIDVGSVFENRKLMKIIIEQDNFDQLIWEYDGDWVHVSYKDRESNRHQILSYDGKKYSILSKEEALKLCQTM